MTIKDDSRKAAITAGQGKEGEVEEEESDFTPSIIIGVLLVIPVVLLLVITLVMRMHHRGQWSLSCLSSQVVLRCVCGCVHVSVCTSVCVCSTRVSVHGR